MKIHVLAITLLLSLGLSACGIPISKNTANLMEDIQKNDVAPIGITNSKEQQATRKEEITDFALQIFRESVDDTNILISPLSIISALGMLANGAMGDTLSQMEHVLNTDIQELNDYLKAYAAYLPNDEKYKISLANSIWFKDDKSLTINKDFLQTNKDYYDASVYKAPFDESTKNDINIWVKDKTNGIIEKLLEEAPKDAVMYLINALSFDAEWAKIYVDTQIRAGEFTLESGAKQTVKFMNSDEYYYLENETATGFIKPYKDNKYSFVALLPKASISMSDFINALKPNDIINMIENKNDEKVYVKMPKFSVEYDTLLNESLQRLGMTDAFNGVKADFTGLGKSEDGNIYLSKVIHKTKIDVDEKGTKAGAVTTAVMETTSAMITEPKEVILDRPFFYMIIDTEQNFPIFMGVLMSVN